MTGQVDLGHLAVEVGQDVHPAALSPAVVERGGETVEENQRGR
jgi:hypothetical protein